MLFLRLFLLLLFGTFAVAAPTSPPSPQRFDSPETDVQPPQTVRWIIPVEGLGYWRRHPDEGKNIPVGGKATDFIHVESQTKVVLWHWDHSDGQAKKQFDMEPAGQLGIAVGRWIRPGKLKYHEDGSMECGPVAENKFEKGTFEMVISDGQNSHA
ncbi:hypothetical protein AX14_005132 [Amanita brunnescens Koide BX004]|nr:hypothetical protein AX14_005132 [Amanita brunnescens Koide BX004]